MDGESRTASGSPPLAGLPAEAREGNATEERDGISLFTIDVRLRRLADGRMLIEAKPWVKANVEARVVLGVANHLLTAAAILIQKAAETTPVLIGFDTLADRLSRDEP